MAGNKTTGSPSTNPSGQSSHSRPVANTSPQRQAAATHSSVKTGVNTKPPTSPILPKAPTSPAGKPPASTAPASPSRGNTSPPPPKDNKKPTQPNKAASPPLKTEFKYKEDQNDAYAALGLENIPSTNQGNHWIPFRFQTFLIQALIISRSPTSRGLSAGSSDTDQLKYLLH